MNEAPRETVNAGPSSLGPRESDEPPPPADAREFFERACLRMKMLVVGHAPSDEVQQAGSAMIDDDELARRTLGSPCPQGLPSCTNHWSELTPEQRTEISALLGALVRKRYFKYLYRIRDYDISCRGANEGEGSRVTIRTHTKSKSKPREPALEIDYVISAGSGRYRVVDIVTEGSSLTKNYYDQFHRMLTTTNQGYFFVVKKLEANIVRP